MKCKHKNKYRHYGYFYNYKVKGIGIGLICEDCGELLEYDLDWCLCNDEEKEWWKKSKYNKQEK